MLSNWNRPTLCVCVAMLFTLSAVGQIATAPATAPLQRLGTAPEGVSEPKQRHVFDESAAAAAAAAAPVTGTFVAKFTIKLVTVVPSGSQVYCQLSATSSELNSKTGMYNNIIEELAVGKGVVNGGSATCNVSLPYAWNLSSPASDTANLSYYLYIANPNGVNASAQTRYSTQYLPGAGSIKVPASGTTTTYLVNSTL